jgi:hypothetical protein
MREEAFIKLGGAALSRIEARDRGTFSVIGRWDYPLKPGARVIPTSLVRSSTPGQGCAHGIDEKHRSRHRTNPTRNRGHPTSHLPNCLEIHVTDQTLIGATDPDIDHGRTRAHEVCCHQPGDTGGSHQEVGPTCDRGKLVRS